MELRPSGAVLGADVAGVDLAATLSGKEILAILRALGTYGVLRFPTQTLTTDQFAVFGARFGALETNVANMFHEPGHPEVMILSNIMKDGKPTGLGDAGQGWHTDMSYSRPNALTTILHARTVPMRNGKPLGDTQFRDMHRAYEDLPASIKVRLKGRTATHDFAKFWDMMRARPGNTRPPLTEAQRARKPAVSYPIFYPHPITGKTVLYCNVGYVMGIDGMEKSESDELLALLYRHQEQEKFLYSHHWTEGDVLMWDNIGTMHNAISDYDDSPRYMRRVQVMATADHASPPT